MSLSPLPGHHLRAVQLEDAELLFAWRDAPRVRSGMVDPRPLHWPSHRTWLKAAISQPGRTALRILEAPSGPVGMVGLLGLDDPHGRVEWTIYVGAADAPAGTGTTLALLGLHECFAVLGRRKLCTQVLVDNEASLRLHTRIGMRREGTLVAHVVRADGPADLAVFGLLAAQWRAQGADGRAAAPHSDVQDSA